MIEKFKNLDSTRKIVISIIIVALLILLKLLIKIGVNTSFIKNYPDSDQEYKLKIISFLNIYEPYIAPYNYGNYYYQKGQYTLAYDKYTDALAKRVPANRFCKVKINLGMTLVKLSEQEVDNEKAILLLDEATQHLEDCMQSSGSDNNQGGGEGSGNKNGNDNEGKNEKDVEGDKNNAKQLEDAIKEKKDELGKNISKQDDNQGNKNNNNTNQQQENSGSSTSKASEKIENVEKQAVKGINKRDKAFQEQSYNNKGQYGQETPGSGCIGACW